ncbi:MAG: replication factor A [Methanocellales archaeon]|nr:replication factor A [Methanocellales archaeon]
MVRDIAEQLKARFSEMGVEVPLEEIEKKLDVLINEFRVPIEEAKRSVVSQYVRAPKSADLVKVKDIQSEGRWVSLKAKVVQLWPSESESIAQAGLIGDETGTIKFTKWAKSDLPLVEENRCYMFKNVVTDEWQGRYNVKLSRSTEIIPLEEDIEVGSLVEEVMGAIVDIQSGSGLIKRCELCNRALVKGSCGEHGKVEGIYDLRIKGVIDDGKIVQDILLNRETTEAVIGITLDEAKEMAAEALDQSVVLDAFKEKLIGRYFSIKGPRVGRYVLVEDIKSAPKISDQEVKKLITETEAL